MKFNTNWSIVYYFSLKKVYYKFCETSIRNISFQLRIHILNKENIPIKCK